MILSVRNAIKNLLLISQFGNMKTQNSGAQNVRVYGLNNKLRLFRLLPPRKVDFIMECPHCHKELAGKECPECGTPIPLESRYCMNCGTRIEESRQGAEISDEFDLENRVLCPDGTCTGIIVNGKCTECGKAPD
jgi:hypothetical protein